MSEKKEVYEIDTIQKKYFIWSLFYDQSNGQTQPVGIPIEKMIDASSVKKALIEKEIITEDGKMSYQFGDTLIKFSPQELNFIKWLYDQKKDFPIDNIDTALFIKNYLDTKLNEKQ